MTITSFDRMPEEFRFNFGSVHVVKRGVDKEDIQRGVDNFARNKSAAIERSRDSGD